MENATLVNNKTKMETAQQMRPARSAEPNLQTKVISAGLAACFADLLTFPLDTAKVRLQIQGEGKLPITGSRTSSAAAGPRYRGLVGTLCTISRQEGPRALYNGLAAGLQRQMCFASVRIGLYDVVKFKYSKALGGVDPNSPNFALRIMAGGTTGAMAVLGAQPTDVVKVRMQAQKAGVKHYTGVFQAYRTIAVEEGIRGLWKGTSPNIARNVVVNCCELVSYDLIKEKLLRSGLIGDHIGCHFTSGVGAGFVTTLIGSPIDVVKTRFMNSGTGTYSGVLNCAMTMFRQEGPRAFYKGFVPSFSRMASWNVIMFVCYEQLKIVLTNRPQLPEISIEPKRFM